MADGTIVDARDGIPDDTPTGSYVIPITSGTAAGNCVVLDIGDRHGTFAFYVHLVPGSLRVKIGDRVTSSQVVNLGP